jgi:hypothetical protein
MIFTPLDIAVVALYIALVPVFELNRQIKKENMRKEITFVYKVKEIDNEMGKNR